MTIQKKNLIIAIDGPAGTGKSTIAKTIAKNYQMMYIDSGAMYRTGALYLHETCLNPHSSDDVNQVAAFLEKAKFEFYLNPETGKTSVLVNSRDISTPIRQPEISMLASQVASKPAVREALLNAQRSVAEISHVVMDGRDIGTVVFPYAQLKIYLTAKPEVRAQRRYDEQISNSDESQTYEEVLADIHRRDYDDMNRSTAPLTKAKDAIEIDTSNLSPEQVYDQINTHIIKLMS